MVKHISKENEQKLKQKSPHKYLDYLIKKQQGLIKEYINIKQFKQPVLIFHRNDRKVFYIEDVMSKTKEGLFIGEHSDGSNRLYNIRDSDCYDYPYKDGSFRAIPLHENSFLPMGNDEPIVPSLRMTEVILQTEASNDKLKLRKHQQEATNKLIMTIAMAIGLLFLVSAGSFVVIEMFAPGVWKYMPWVDDDKTNNVQVAQNINSSSTPIFQEVNITPNIKVKKSG